MTSFRQYKNYILGLLGLLLLGAAVGVWFWFFPIKVKEAQKSPERLSDEISRTRERLEELSRISPAEKEKREKERQVLSAREIKEDVAVSGVNVRIEGERKIVDNHAMGYRFELPLNLVLARSITADTLEFYDRELMCAGDPECEPVFRVRVQEGNPDGLLLEEWFLSEEKKAGVPLYTPREKLILGERIAYRVEEVIPAKFEGYYYYWGKGKKIFILRVSKIDEEVYRKFIETFIPL